MYLDELAIGLCAEIVRHITHDDISTFADVSGDRNPVHLDHDYARQTAFGGIIAHGMLSASFISSILGTQLPGEGTIYLGQSLRFLAPVRAGQRVVATARVVERPGKKIVVDVEARADEVVVLSGRLTCFVPPLDVLAPKLEETTP